MGGWAVHKIKVDGGYISIAWLVEELKKGLSEAVNNIRLEREYLSAAWLYEKLRN